MICLVLACCGDAAGVADEHVDILAVLAVLEDVGILRLPVLDVNDAPDQLVVLLDAFAVPSKGQRGTDYLT